MGYSDETESGDDNSNAGRRWLELAAQRVRNTGMEALPEGDR